MLESIYINEGFWVGRYEAGSGTIVMKDDEKNSIPLSQQNMYPYNYVTIIEAKTLAETVDSGNLLSSLMFGIQWDLILAFFHNMNDIDNELLLGNSISFGNYNNNLWSINNLNAKYSKYDLSDFKFCPYKKETTESILLTTGADKSFSIANIYDLAGNVWEWTLEKNLNDEKSIVYRGGSYYDNGVSKPISYRDSMKELGKSVNIGFRVTMY